MRRRRMMKHIPPADYHPGDFVDKEYIDIVKYYSLRIILELGGFWEFVNQYNDLTKDSLSYFLELNEFIENDSDTYTKNDVRQTLQKRYKEVMKRTPDIAKTPLYKNIEKLRKYIVLSHEEIEILAFVVLLRQYDVLEQAVDLLGDELNSMQALRKLGKILNISQKSIEQIFRDSILFRSGLITFDDRARQSIDRKIDLMHDRIAEKLFQGARDPIDLFRDAFCKMDVTSLRLEDFSHVQKDLDILVPYLKKALSAKQNGVNILLYGKPGTGKTELSKLLSQILQRDLYEVSYVDYDGEAIDGSRRLKAYKMAQMLLSNSNAMLLYDEAEDIFESFPGFLFFAPSRQKDKAWINRMLESNEVPTIWITNNNNAIDPAIVRRFDYVMEMPIPPISKRKEVLHKYAEGILDEGSIEILAKDEHVAPAVVSRAAKVINTLQAKEKKEQFIQIVNNTLKAQGHKEILIYSSLELPAVYDPSYINCSADLEELARGIAQNPNARICFYGAPGTGKSAYAKYVAKILQKPYILKKGSELLSMWVGGMEKNIAQAFEEAKESDAVLIFDEVDSFLQDRGLAQRSWEITQVNEMLVQMENFDGVFFATTNLMDNLDRASHRRFDLKVEFGYLRGEQVWQLFVAYAKELGIEVPKELQKEAQSLRFANPGDFATIIRQSRFRPIKSAEDLLKRLREEIALKRMDGNSSMGFISH